MFVCGVYKITNIQNGKIYVGSSKNIKKRWKQHIDALNANKHNNLHLQRAWNKYREENFKFNVIEECEPCLQFEREQFYLNKLNPFDSNGYNIVRQISKDYMSDHWIIKKCIRCNHEFNTFSNLSKYCDNCKKEIQEENKEDWLEMKNFYISPIAEERIFNASMCGIYGNMNYFYDITD